MARTRVPMPGVGERIRQLREARRMSQTELAIASGYKAADSLGKVERGQTMPTSQSLQALADALETSVSWLVHGEDDRRKVRDTVPPPLTEESWIDMLGASAPASAREVAAAAWRMAKSAVPALPRPAGVPTISPPSRSDDPGLVAPAGGRMPASGMRSKAASSRAPARKSERPATRRR